MTDLTQGAKIWRSQGLHATVHRACANCQAPGVFSFAEHVRTGWPGCYVDPLDDRVDQPVVDRCPNCSFSRKPTLMERLGEIWRRNYV